MDSAIFIVVRNIFFTPPGFINAQRYKPFGSLLVFRARDETGEKGTKGGGVALGLPQFPHSPVCPHSRWPPAKWCSGESRAALVAKETRLPEMRNSGRERALGQWEGTPASQILTGKK